MMNKKIIILSISCFMILQGTLFAQTQIFKESFEGGSPDDGRTTGFAYWAQGRDPVQGGTRIVTFTFADPALPDGSFSLTGGGLNSVNNNTGDFRVYESNVIDFSTFQDFSLSAFLLSENNAGPSPNFRFTLIDADTGAQQTILNQSLAGAPLNTFRQYTNGNFSTTFDRAFLRVENLSTNAQGNDWAVDNIQILGTTPIPEPSSLLFLSASLLGLLRSSRRRV